MDLGVEAERAPGGLAHPLDPAFAEAVLENDVSPFGVTALAHSLLERFEATPRQLGGAYLQNPDPRDLRGPFGTLGFLRIEPLRDRCGL